jgi:hypothetical protein
MTTKRKLAACLAHMRDPVDQTRPLVPGADRMTDDEIIASVEFDHAIALNIGGRDEAHNIVPLPVAYHRQVKTPLDQKIIAKARHVRNAELAFRDRLLARAEGDDQRVVKKRHIPSRPFPKRSRPIGAAAR